MLPVLDQGAIPEGDRLGAVHLVDAHRQGVEPFPLGSRGMS
jgi:hypothetical protein